MKCKYCCGEIGKCDDFKRLDENYYHIKCLNMLSDMIITKLCNLTNCTKEELEYTVFYYLRGRLDC